jgi:hypothetical protein
VAPKQDEDSVIISNPAPFFLFKTPNNPQTTPSHYAANYGEAIQEHVEPGWAGSLQTKYTKCCNFYLST